MSASFAIKPFPWADQQLKQMTKRRTTKYLIVHHSMSRDVSAVDIHKWHLNEGWIGIGYHFVIRADGNVEQGRPLWAIGSHAGPKGNPSSIGVCLAGDFRTNRPTTAQMKTLIALYRWLEGQFPGLQPSRHKDWMATVCPGPMFPWDEFIQGISAPAAKMRLVVNGRVLDREVKVVDGRTLIVFDDGVEIPARLVAESLGGKVNYDKATQSVMIAI